MNYIPRLKALIGREEKEFISIKEKREKPIITLIKEKVKVVKGFRILELSLLKIT